VCLIKTLRGYVERWQKRRLLRRAIWAEDRRSYDEAILLYDKLRNSGRRGDTASLEIEIEAVTRKASLLSRVRQSQAAIDAATDLIRLLDGIETSKVRKRRGWALLLRGQEYAHSGQPQEAMSDFDTLLQLFAFDYDSEMDEHVAESLVAKGILLSDTDNIGGALACFDQVARRFGSNTDIEMQRHLADAAYAKAELLTRIGRMDDSRHLYQSIAHDFAESPATALRLTAVRARLALSDLAAAQCTKEENLQAYNDVLARIPDVHDSTTQALRGAVYGRIGSTYEIAEQWTPAAEAFARMITALEGLEDKQSRENLYWALYQRGSMYAHNNQAIDALEAYNALLKVYDARMCRGAVGWVAAALLESGVLLGQMGRLDEEIEVYETLRREFGDSTEVSIRDAVIGSFVNSVVALRQLGRNTDAGVLDAALLKRRFDGIHDSALIVAESNRDCPFPGQLRRYG
jgi:tetratricopeptide (TPR) repeat protein